MIRGKVISLDENSVVEITNATHAENTYVENTRATAMKIIQLS